MNSFLQRIIFCGKSINFERKLNVDAYKNTNGHKKQQY